MRSLTCIELWDFGAAAENAWAHAGPGGQVSRADRGHRGCSPLASQHVPRRGRPKRRQQRLPAGRLERRRRGHQRGARLQARRRPARRLLRHLPGDGLHLQFRVLRHSHVGCGDDDWGSSVHRIRGFRPIRPRPWAGAGSDRPRAAAGVHRQLPRRCPDGRSAYVARARERWRLCRGLPAAVPLGG